MDRAPHLPPCSLYHPPIYLLLMSQMGAIRSSAKPNHKSLAEYLEIMGIQFSAALFFSDSYPGTMQYKQHIGHTKSIH